jgi:hypothetical protein
MDDLIFTLFQWMAAVVSTGAFVYFVSHLCRGSLSHKAPWLYATGVLGIVTVYRWFIVWVKADGNESAYAAAAPWISPFTQTGYMLLTIALLVLCYAHITAKTAHFLEQH